jgi:CYTH domain-containing protein
VPPFGIDVFHDTLEGLFLAEAEFDTPLEADALALPSFILREVSADRRFTGGELARASRRDLQFLLLENGISSISL